MTTRAPCCALGLLAAIGCARADGPIEPDAASPPHEVQPVLLRSAQLCKLLSDRNVSDATENDVQHTVTYTMSSFSPYNVALFQTVFAK